MFQRHAPAINQIAEPLNHNPGREICKSEKLSRNNMAVRVQASGKRSLTQPRLIRRCNKTVIGSHRIRHAAGLDHADTQSSARLIVAANDDRRADAYSKSVCGFGVQRSGDRSGWTGKRKLIAGQADGIQNFFGPAVANYVKGEESRRQRISDVWRKSKFDVNKIRYAEESNRFGINFGPVPA